MTSLEESFARPEFESVELDIDADEAHRYIEDAIKGLATSDTEAGTKYRTMDGMLVAIVGPRPNGSGDGKAKLAYRTEPASELATRKGSKIFDALKPHVSNE